MGPIAPIKGGKVFLLESAGNFNGAIAPEVIENYTVAVFDFAHGLLTIVHNHKPGQILINAVVLLPIGFNGFFGRAESSAFAPHMDVPTFFHHVPVGFVTIHGNLHSAASGCNFHIKMIVPQFGQEDFKRFHIFQRRSLSHISAIYQNVDAHVVDVFFFSLGQHGFQVRNIGVYVAVGEQSYKMQGVRPAYTISRQPLPGVRSKHFAAFDGSGNQFGPLGKNLSCTQSVVAHFRVAHVVIRG